MKPRVALTSGDPAGIGPEIVAKAAADPRVLEVCEPRIYAPPPDLAVTPGRVDPRAGRAAYDVVVSAVGDAMRGRVDAVATAPVSKEAFAIAGLPWKGHTDLLGHLTGSSFVAMMFESPALRVVLATVHRCAAGGAATAHDGADDPHDRPRPASCPPRRRRAANRRGGPEPHAGEHGLMDTKTMP
jgi:4-hydroxythreonine-4-phosphate dehydrogenase